MRAVYKPPLPSIAAYGWGGPRDSNIDAAAERIRLRLRRAAEDVVTIGHELITVRTAIGPEKFQEWIAEEFQMSRSSAYRFIAAGERFPDPILGLSPSVLYLLAEPSTPDEVVEEVKAKVAKGETVNVAEVRRLRAENERLEAERNSAAASSKSLAKQVSDLRGQLEEAPRFIPVEPDYREQIRASIAYFGALPIPVREAVWNAFATPYARAKTTEGGDHVTAFTQEQDSEAGVHASASTQNGGVAYAEDEKHAAADPSHELEDRRAASGSDGLDSRNGGDGGRDEQADPSEAHAAHEGPPLSGEEGGAELGASRSGGGGVSSRGSVKDEWPDCPPGLLRDKANPLAKLESAESEDAFGGLEFDKPGFSDAARA